MKVFTCTVEMCRLKQLPRKNPNFFKVHCTKFEQNRHSIFRNHALNSHNLILLSYVSLVRETFYKVTVYNIL